MSPILQPVNALFSFLGQLLYKDHFVLLSIIRCLTAFFYLPQSTGVIPTSAAQLLTQVRLSSKHHWRCLCLKAPQNTPFWGAEKQLILPSPAQVTDVLRAAMSHGDGAVAGLQGAECLAAACDMPGGLSPLLAVTQGDSGLQAEPCTESQPGSRWKCFISAHVPTCMAERSNILMFPCTVVPRRCV